MADEIRGWLSDALARRTRHPELEQTLFHRLHELEQGPIEQLGELVRAVIDELRNTQQRLADQARDLAGLQQTVAHLSGRLDELATRPPEPAPLEAGHLLLLPSPGGYRLADCDGPPPPLGEPVEHEGRRYRTLSRNASPHPGDRRPCLLALPESAA
jgi:hypothetical protein